jgi:hypothetical protein
MPRLTTKNVTLSIVGEGEAFTSFEDEAVRPFLDAIDADGDAAMQEAPDAPTAAPADAEAGIYFA